MKIRRKSIIATCSALLAVLASCVSNGTGEGGEEPVAPVFYDEGPGVGADADRPRPLPDPDRNRGKGDAERYVSSWGRSVLSRCLSVALGTVRKVYSIKSGLTVAGFEIEEVLFGLGRAKITILVASPDPSWFCRGDRAVLFLAADEGAEHYRAIDKIGLADKGSSIRVEAARKYIAMEAMGDRAARKAEFKKLLFAGLSSADRWMAENAVRELFILTEREPELFDAADLKTLADQARATRGETRDNLEYCIAHVEVIPPLWRAVSDPDPEKRVEYMKSAGALFDPEGPGAGRIRHREDVVFQLYRTTDDPAGRAGIVSAAARIGSQRLLTGVYKALWDSSPVVRTAALEGLRRRGSRAHGKRVAEMLSDPFPEVRMEAVLALARVGDESSPGILEELAENDSEIPRIRAAAARVAAAMRGK